MIDAHQHFWQIGEHGCTWPGEDLAAIHRDFMPEDLVDTLAAQSVEGTVLIQSQPDDADTDFLLDLAANAPFIKAVVGWVDLASPEAPERIAALANNEKLKGLRPMLQGLPDDDWILSDELAPAIAAMIEHDLSFDALVFTRHLPAIRTLASRWPDLAIVIDHGAKPPLASGTLEDWETQLRQTARQDGIWCKLSGLPTEAKPDHTSEDLRPAIRTILDAFGEARVIWGSDWPVLTLAGDYASWLALCRSETGNSDAIHDGNARRFYRF